MGIFAAEGRASCPVRALFGGPDDTGSSYYPAVATVVLAHPLTEVSSLPISPLAAGGIAAALAVALALYWPRRRATTAPPAEVAFDSWEGSLRPSQVVARVVGFGLLVLAVVAGRLGDTGELDNVWPPLVIGLVWPALILLAATLGPVWRWLDPWDGAARVLERKDTAGSLAGSVYLAVLPALLWVWYLGVYPTPLAPRSVGLALGVYAVGTIGGCLALGRRQWLARAEVFGLFFGWLARLPRGALGRWRPPAGAAVVLSVLVGGILFAAIRRTELWGGLNAVPAATEWATVGLLGTCAAFAAALWALDRRSGTEGDARKRPSDEDGSLARGGAGSLEAGSVVPVAIPMVGAIALAVAMARRRLFTSLSLVPRVFSDPLGRGWDAFGSSDHPIAPPLSDPQLALVQLAVLVSGVVAGSFILARLEPRARIRGTLALVLLACGGTIAVMLAPGVAPR